MGAEKQLIDRCKRNDRQAQKLLFDKYSSRMLGVCLRYCKDYEDARDVMQEGFVKVFTKISTFKGESSLATWMTRIFVNLSLNRLRQARLKYQHIDIDDVHHDLAGEMDDDVGGYEWDQKGVLQAVQSLPDIYRTIINLYAVDGMSHQEIAKMLNVTVGTSKSRLSRARVMLKELLAKNK